MEEIVIYCVISGYRMLQQCGLAGALKAILFLCNKIIHPEGNMCKNNTRHERKIVVAGRD